MEPVARTGRSSARTRGPNARTRGPNARMRRPNARTRRPNARTVAPFGRSVAALALLAVIAAGCSSTEEPPPGSTPTATTSPDDPGPPTDATIYYLVESDDTSYVTPETHQILGDDARARLEAMLRGTPQDPDHFSPWPADAGIIDVTLQSGTAIINWNAATLAASVGAETVALAIQQAVWTVTELDGIERVEFIVEGRKSGEIDGRAIEDWWGHVGLNEQPFTRNEDVLAPITITAPAEGAEVTGTVTVEGEATVFEANVTLRLQGPDGTTLERTFATASEGAPGRGTWSKEIELPEEPGIYTIAAVEISAEDGRDLFTATRSIQVTG